MSDSEIVLRLSKDQYLYSFWAGHVIYPPFDEEQKNFFITISMWIFFEM